MTRTTIVGVAVFAAGAAAQTPQFNVTATDTRAVLGLPATGSGTPFTPGTGNSNTNFAVTQITETGGAFDGNVIELAIKAKERFIGDSTVGGVGSNYIVPPGFSRTSSSDPTPDTGAAFWNIDFSVDYGSRTLNDVLVSLSITDPQGDSVTFGFATGPLSPFTGAEQIVQGSQNIGFGFIATQIGFDPFLAGDYTIALTAEFGTSVIGSTSATVTVTPAPGAGAALAIAGLVGVRRRR